MLRFKGSAHLRQRLLLSTLTGRGIRVDDIRADDQSPGLRDYEASLLRLLEKVTNGCVIEINETGDGVGWFCLFGVCWWCVCGCLVARSCTSPSLPHKTKKPKK